MRMLQWANRGPVFCMICGKMRENQMLLIKHVYLEHRMQCGHCDERFTNQQRLACHMLTHQNEKYLSRKTLTHCNIPVTKDKRDSDTLMFKCEICSLSFLRRFDQKKHKIKYHSNMDSDPNKENGGDTFKCEDKLKSNQSKRQGDIMANEESLSEGETHYKSDSDGSVTGGFSEDLFVKPEVRLFEAKYSCTSCSYSCNVKRELILHERNIHSLHNTNKSRLKKNKPFYCEVCKNSYKRKADLQRHILNMHKNEEFSVEKNNLVNQVNVEINQAKKYINGIIVYRCEECGKHLRTKKGFVRHVRVHTGERPFTCHICGKQYRSNADLSRHLKCVHERIKKYQCDICELFFANKATKNDHRRTHTGEKPFMCDVCGKSFPTPNSIYIHRRIHTNYFPHECKTCAKKFRRKQQLVHHTRTHTGEKPHACDVCGKCFAIKDEVTRHKLTHSSEKPYICPNCGIAFAQKRYLTNHIKTHHVGFM